MTGCLRRLSARLRGKCRFPGHLDSGRSSGYVVLRAGTDVAMKRVMETMNATDRRATLNARIEYRDELIGLAIEAVAGRLDLRRMVDLHCDLNVFIDGNAARFPGVISRLRAALSDCGWTYARGAEALATYNALPRSTVNGAVVPDGKCLRCGGAGRISAYSHISGGECFDCGGTGRADDCEVA